MSELVTDDVEGLGKPDEDAPIAIAVTHLFAGPECVIQPLAEMDARNECHAVIIKRVTIEKPPVKIISGPRVTKCFIHRGICAFFVSLPATRRPGRSSKLPF